MLFTYLEGNAEYACYSGTRCKRKNLRFRTTYHLNLDVTAMVDSSRERLPHALYPRTRMVSWLLRFCGLIDCLALLVVVLPDTWIRQMHSHMGMERFPDESIAMYLARSSSLMYAVHGLLLLYLSNHVQRYASLIRFLAWISLGHGMLLVAIDMQIGMPWWWTSLEGPLLFAWGVTVLWLLPTD